MKLQLSPNRIIKDALTIWHEAGPEVDIVMDVANVSFREGSVTEMYVFHVVDHLFEPEALKAMASWFKCLSPEGKVHILNDDFEYIARAFVGGDISIEMFNDLHNHPLQCTRDNISALLAKAGFRADNVNIWLSGNPEGMTREHYEFILTAKKHHV
jgi:predicted SAM-dependent methyltransferase